MVRLALMIALLASTCLASPVPSRVFDPYYTRPTALVAPEQWLDKRSAEPAAGRKGYNALPQATPAATVEGVGTREAGRKGYNALPQTSPASSADGLEAREAGRGGYNGPPVKDPPDVEPDSVKNGEILEARDSGRGGFNGADKAPDVVGPDVMPTEGFKREAETEVIEPQEPQPRDPGRVR
ncbi:hypothetical protein B0A48_02080 [Cryoendolithus antarcticus]|uniref:Uncharacterized protein n=1 Tax=Cryoendolithus antarcticus TaxID=1507870 RepID=A0A1V8TMZ0_9PEZI|nr:hypothetical protein B0A48_02080 [Cryoendolithus antarcticus]